MNVRQPIVGILLLLVSLQGHAMAEPPVPLEQRWQESLNELQVLQQQWQVAGNQEARARLQQEHWQVLQLGLHRLVACEHGWPQMQGGGLSAGALLGKPLMPEMAADNLEQVDGQIRVLELLLDQLDAHREMLIQP